MGELIVLDAYRRTCHNCLWHDDAHGACKRPGGWEWDKNYTRCVTFAWRYGWPGPQGGRGGSAAHGGTASPPAGP